MTTLVLPEVLNPTQQRQGHDFAVDVLDRLPLVTAPAGPAGFPRTTAEGQSRNELVHTLFRGSQFSRPEKTRIGPVAVPARVRTGSLDPSGACPWRLALGPIQPALNGCFTL